MTIINHTNAVWLFVFLQMFENSSASLPPAAALVNSSYEEANSSLAEVERTHQDSLQLLKNVTEAEGRYDSYDGLFAQLSFTCVVTAILVVAPDVGWRVLELIYQRSSATKVFLCCVIQF